MHPIEVYKISKDVVMCESVHNLPVTSFYDNVYLTDRMGGIPTDVVINNEHWLIKRFTNFANMGRYHHERYRTEPDRFDKYIAVDPVLEELLTIEIKQDYEQQLNNLRKYYQYDINKYSRRILVFSELPWYKRIWRAIKNEL